MSPADVAALFWVFFPIIFLYQIQHQCSIYKEISDHYMAASVNQLYKDAGFIFQQHLAPEQKVPILPYHGISQRH